MNDRKSLKANIFALGSVQILNYLLPLITLPYITRVLGVDAWGTIAMVQIVLGYFTMVTNWGFSWSATQQIAAIRDDINKVSKLFIATWAAQWVLSFFCVLVLLVLVYFIPFFNNYALLYWIGIGSIISSVMFPVWFLTGMEMLRQVASIQIIVRILSVPLIFFLVKKPDDIYILMGINVSSSVIGGMLAVIWIKKNMGLLWASPAFNEIVLALAGGASVFMSTFWISLYTTLTPTILGIVSGPTSVAYFSLADKIRSLAQSVLSPISQSLFPRMSYLFENDKSQAINFLIKSSKIILLLSGSVSVFLWFSGEYIIMFMAGKKFLPAVEVMKWLAFLPFVISLSNIFGVQIMLPNRKIKAFNRILNFTAILSLSAIYFLIKKYAETGAAINIFMVESFVSFTMAIYLWRAGFFNQSNKWCN